MGWFDRLFRPKSNSLDTQRNSTMLSTNDAFSLPTTPPFYRTYPDSYARDEAGTPDMEATTSTSYAYPPTISSPAYDHVPTSAGRTPHSGRHSSLLPTHMNGQMSPLPPYPSLTQTWNRLRAWLSREYPELGDTLNWGILPQDLAEAEMALGFALPTALRESYLAVDGQEAESSAGCSEGLFFGLFFLPLSEVIEEWRFWREVDEDPATGANAKLKEVMQSIPPGWVRKQYSQRGWIPLITDKTGNYLGVDMNPGEGGAVGQVIVFGRDFDTKVVMWRGDGPAGWAKWLLSFVEELESGEGFELGSTNESEGSEDSVGYESYFYEGGRGNGEGGGEGAGGLHLTGEYRGWNVLEAWADRSVKRWTQAGLVPSESPEKKLVSKHDSTRLGLGVLDLASADDSATVVPIPVLSEPGSSQPATPIASRSSGPRSLGSSLPSRGALPTISVTKPPAPLPVSLPSLTDIMVSETTPSSFDHDLERGPDMPMNDVDHPLALSDVRITLPSPSPAPQERAPIEESMLVSLPSDESSSTYVTDGSPSGSDSTSFVPDLLQTDMMDGVQIAPIKPEISGSPLTETQTEASLSKVEPSLQDHPSLEDLPEIDENVNPDNTIRLIGGGGVSGIASDLVNEPEEIAKEPELNAGEVKPAPSSISSNNSAKVGSKHEKRASLVSLKKFGRIGGSKRSIEKDN